MISVPGCRKTTGKRRSLPMLPPLVAGLAAVALLGGCGSSSGAREGASSGATTVATVSDASFADLTSLRQLSAVAPPAEALGSDCLGREPFAFEESQEDWQAKGLVDSYVTRCESSVSSDTVGLQLLDLLEFASEDAASTQAQRFDDAAAGGGTGEQKIAVVSARRPVPAGTKCLEATDTSNGTTSHECYLLDGRFFVSVLEVPNSPVPQAAELGVAFVDLWAKRAVATP